MKTIRTVAVCVAAVFVAVLVLRAETPPRSDAPLTVHEWGTFTALQDDAGRALGAINADDEPVPSFVCRIGNFRTFPARSQLTPWLTGGKGLQPCHPDVTMRLETPVIYFYPPPTGWTAPINVRVLFRGGWLTEFYPRAVAEASGLLEASSGYPPITTTTNGSLAWNNVKLNALGDLVQTDDPVWTAPREVPRAATVKVPAPPGKVVYPTDDPEKFLFYRGVGHLDSPLRVVRDNGSDLLTLYSNVSALDPLAKRASSPDLRVPAAWLLEIRPEDGFCAFRPLPGGLDLNTLPGQPLTSLPASFSPGEFGPQRVRELQAAMHVALVSAGLFEDEAAAMLKTWELSYFKSPGRRLFYVTPRAWTEQVLPLTINGAEITRVMMGRIELITPAQRALLNRIAAGPCPDMQDFMGQYNSSLSAAYQAWSNRVQTAGGPETQATWKPPTLAEMNISVPAIYQDYLNLGRFRDALVLDEQQRRPVSALAAFIAGNGLQAR